MRPAHLTKSDLVPAEAPFDSPMHQSVARPLPVGAKARRLQRRLLFRDHSLEGLFWLFDQ